MAKKNYTESMQYQFEYFYIYKGKLLLGESIDAMEELLELAAVEEHLGAIRRKRSAPYKSHSSARANSSR